MRIKSQRDFLSGLLFVALGIAFAWGATLLRIGSAQRMGAGWFPLAMGIVLAVIGGFIVFGSLVVETEDGEPAGPLAWRALAAVLGSTLLFAAVAGGVPAIGLPPMGIAAAMLALAFVCSLAGPGWNWARALVVSVVLAVAGVAATLVFKLALPLWPAFLAG